MDLTFDNNSSSLIATYEMRSDGSATVVYLFDGAEISASEYAAIEAASLDRYFATHNVES